MEETPLGASLNEDFLLPANPEGLLSRGSGPRPQENLGTLFGKRIEEGTEMDEAGIPADLIARYTAALVSESVLFCCSSKEYSGHREHFIAFDGAKNDGY